MNIEESLKQSIDNDMVDYGKIGEQISGITTTAASTGAANMGRSMDSFMDTKNAMEQNGYTGGQQYNSGDMGKHINELQVSANSIDAVNQKNINKIKSDAKRQQAAHYSELMEMEEKKYQEERKLSLDNRLQELKENHFELDKAIFANHIKEYEQIFDLQNMKLREEIDKNEVEISDDEIKYKDLVIDLHRDPMPGINSEKTQHYDMFVTDHEINEEAIQLYLKEIEEALGQGGINE